MHIDDLKYFISIVDNQSINKAAKELLMTQPALSTAISKMEDELGTELLKRSFKGVVPTEAGEKIYNDAKMILATIDSWYKVADCSSSPEGNVHILAVPTACNYLTSTLINTARTAYPRIRIYLHQSENNSILPQLIANKFNLGICSIFSFEKEHIMENIIRRKWKAKVIYEDEREVFLSPDHPLAQKEYLEIEDLKQLTLACYSIDDDTIGGKVRPYFNPDYYYHLDSQYNMLQLAAENKSVSIFAPKISKIHPLVKHGLVVSRPVRGLSLRATYLLIYPSDNILSNAEKEIVKLITKLFSEL